MLTRRMQIQAIADRLAGLDSTLKARNFTEPFSLIWEALDETNGRDSQAAILAALRGHPKQDEIMLEVLQARAGYRLGPFPSLKAMEEAGDLPDIEWFWRDWIPRGMLSLLTASPGAGKSLLALDLAARVVTGQPFPDGKLQPRPEANVVYVDAEAVPQIHNQRIRWWNVDTDRLFFLLPPPNALFVNLDEQEYRDQVVEMVASLNPPLVIVDSLSTVTLRGENNKEDIMQVLGFLNRVAQEFDCAVLLVHHLRKRGVLPLGDVLTQDDVRGSGHIVAAARSVLGLSIIQVGPEPDKNGPRRLEILKTNLCRYPEALGMELVPLHPEGVMLKYGDAPSRWEEPTKSDQCEAWLLDMLEEAGEPMRPQELVTLAAEDGFSRSLVYQARKRLEGRVINTHGRQAPQNSWALPEMLDPSE